MKSDTESSGSGALRGKVHELVREMMEESEQRQQDMEDARFARSPEARSQRRTKWLAVALLVVLLAGGAIYIVVSRSDIMPLPDEAVGLWTTEEPRYADRAFRLTANTFTVFTSATDSIVHPITGVTGSSDRLSTLVNVEYADFGETYVFSFYLSPDTLIRFKNQREMEWRKTDTRN